MDNIKNHIKKQQFPRLHYNKTKITNTTKNTDQGTMKQTQKMGSLYPLHPNNKKDNQPLTIYPALQSVSMFFISDSKWWQRNFINNSTLSLLFILFHNCWNLQKCWMYGCAFENVFTTSFSIAYTTCHLQDIKQTPRLR